MNTFTKFLTAVAFMLVMIFFCRVQPIQASELAEVNTISLSNVGDLYGDLGPLKLLMLALTPKDQRPLYYHTVSIDASENCKMPNKWYFAGLVEDDICRQMEKDGYNVVCNTACPEAQKTGITCGLAHECCMPPESEPIEKKEEKPVRCAPEGASRGIQYCTFY